MENNFEMRLTPLLSNVIIKEVSQKLANQLLSKFKEQTKDSDETILSIINKFDKYKEGLDQSKRDITKYKYADLKSLIIGKEMEKAADTAFTKLKKKWDKLKQSNPELYQYADATLKGLVARFYDMYPMLKPEQRDIMKYDYLELTDFIQKNYSKLMNVGINKKMEKDPDLTNKEALLFYIQSFIQNRDRVPRGTKPVLAMTFHELEQLVDGTLAQGDEGAEKYSNDYEGIDRVYDENNLIVFAPKSKDQCVRLKNGRTWCTSREGGGNLYYNYRLGNERTLYYVIDQDKPFKDLNYASVILVDPYGRMALADGSNSGRYSGHQNIPWSEIEEKIPKLKGKESLFQPKPLTQEEKELINVVRNMRVGDNPMEDGDEKTIEMWLEYNSPKLNDTQYANLTPELQKKYISLGFDLTGSQLASSAQGVLTYYVNKKKEKLINTPFNQLSASDVELLSLPMMSKIRESLKEKFASSLVNVSKDGQQVEISYPDDAVSKYIRLYGLEEFIENVPDTIDLFSITNTEGSSMNLELPPSFKRFKNLETFHGRNIVTKFPEVLKGMNSLEFITLPHNPGIDEIPEWVADLPNLLAIGLNDGNPNVKIGPKVMAKIDEGMGFII